MMFLEAMFAGAAWRKFREGRQSELAFADACRFWSLNEKMSGQEARTRLERVRKDLEDIGRRVSSKNAVLRDGHSVSPEDVSTLLDTDAFLRKRFARVLRYFER
jgi:hypothetical protein